MPDAVPQSPPPPDPAAERAAPRALIGWTHDRLAGGIALNLQSAASKVDLDSGQVETARLAMTDNQALLLARYLMIASGHEIDDLRLPRRPWWERLRRGERWRRGDA